MASLAKNIGAYNLGVCDGTSWGDDDTDDEDVHGGMSDDSMPGSLTVTMDDF